MRSQPCVETMPAQSVMFGEGTMASLARDLIVNVQDDAQRLEIERLSRDANLIKNHILTAGGVESVIPTFQKY